MPEALSTIAELGIGIAGFSGVVVAIGFRRSSLELLDRVRVIGLLFGSFGAALLAALPLVLNGSGVAIQTAWRLSSWAFVLHLFSFLAFALVSRRQLSNADAGELHPIMSLFVMGGMSVCTLAVGWNALHDPSAGPYLGGLYFLLLYSCLQFVRLLLVRPIDSPSVE